MVVSSVNGLVTPQYSRQNNPGLQEDNSKRSSGEENLNILSQAEAERSDSFALLDSFVVLYIAFVLGPQQWPVSLFLAVGTVNYGYKMAAAVLLIPVIYAARRLIERYLGAGEAARLKAVAAAD